MQQSEQIVVGRIGAVYGVKGWLKVQSFTDDPESIFEYSPWLLSQKTEREMKVVEWRRHNNGLIARLEGISDRDEAARLTGADICITADELPALADDEFYWRDLIGMRVVNTNGYDMGVVEQIMPTASNDVLVVKANSNDGFGKSERLIPFIQSEYVTAVDKEAKQIQVEWPSDF
ncbi:ribosome maturation factor RimM [Idiomarina loihiensis]|jgi:16S rRNA processing protein RimM|uniref:Ribosome maturation factor RimM n=1 Tax=Idiomarina loihiensis (strain ATCC BAA-735 / DSM 15497 / L2-TR) TaxID=283942 RepID=RIMM_IDILO|nr:MULTISPECIES: ribosome maturation factor RimM [Idiomarina]Q5QUU9.1 RecName: Full=Ribosome maturation factor RimM [Idiomarina loihiensis L2TR]NWO03197.1 ribosome maturation factor RimM [Idiomarinaceae bacterium]AAV82558.1 RimM [Idiomarina loihiensis L2TR]AGM36599.1 16S rRNA-processing protein RimM [Idiomarina loihiensis GSL 199]MAA62483.1 ribosome maturation factor RimM [Idiomarina sp.]MBL4857437.1 ribosome maturation factor RimM [Idiomarina sp.]|tara:strand:+ start:325 stop:849 length:525 start_codon:yes stop_codon:yes gene_type:complete